jgi:hypothetical protein
MSFFRPKTPSAYLLIGIAIGAFGGACAAGANQPHMQSALNSLQAARAELVQAAPDKGGYRARDHPYRRSDQRDRAGHQIRRRLMHTASSKPNQATGVFSGEPAWTPISSRPRSRR